MPALTLDDTHLQRAIRLGRRALGTTAENPPVGCVIAKGERIVGVGWTAPGGRPHAEAQALAMAGGEARGATAYVTLEPCAHHGRTPPCADALIQAGVARVVSASEDPDPRTKGRGHRRLREAGIAIDVQEAPSELAGFFTRVLRNRPQVTLKLALSTDNKIAERPGERSRLTGETANARTHLLRAQSDAILVGIGTVIADDPDLTCRLPGLEGRSPVRVILSAHRSLPPESRLARSASSVPVWVAASIAEALAKLANEDINNLLVEGGAHVARSFIEAGVVDRLILIRAPMTLGGQGLDAFAGLPLPEAIAGFKSVAEERLGADTLTLYEKRA